MRDTIEVAKEIISTQANEDTSAMEAAIRARLMQLSVQLGGELAAIVSEYADMPDYVKSSPFYRTLGERISSVEALFNTLVSTAASFPEPAKETVQ
jgi:hypothetical protein